MELLAKDFNIDKRILELVNEAEKEVEDKSNSYWNDSGSYSFSHSAVVKCIEHKNPRPFSLGFFMPKVYITYHFTFRLAFACFRKGSGAHS